MANIRKETFFDDLIALLLAMIIVQVGVLFDVVDIIAPREVYPLELKYEKVATARLEEDMVFVDNLVYAGAILDTHNINNIIPVQQSISENKEVYKFENTGYTTAALNIRAKASTESEIVNTIGWNEPVQYSVYSNEWYVIEYEGQECFIYSKYVSDNKAEYNKISVFGDKRKSLESYSAITDKTSKQYRIQQSSTTDSEGFRRYKGRYEVAIGTAYNAPVGTYFDAVLSNGTVIECIVGDIKQDCDTNVTNTIGNDGSCLEFIVNIGKVNSEIKSSGNASNKEGWLSEVVEIRVYPHTI